MKLANYQDSRVLITGGDGFIGSNLTSRLLDLGSEITVFTKKLNPFWKKEFSNKKNIRVIEGEISSKDDVLGAVKNQNYIFHLAGISGAVDSNKNPYLDLEINCKGSLNLLEACKDQKNNKIRVLFPSSQLVYGHPEKLPILENHPKRPTSIYGIHKNTIENYFMLYNHLYGLGTVVLRIPNPYGPRQSMDHSYGIVNYFIGQAIKNGGISIYGEGKQLRDYIYIDDLVEAMLLANSHPNSPGKIYNVSGNGPIGLSNMASVINRLLPETKINFVAWPEDATKTEVGDIYLDSSYIKKDLGWLPKTCLNKGIAKTIQYYSDMLPQ